MTGFVVSLLWCAFAGFMTLFGASIGAKWTTLLPWVVQVAVAAASAQVFLLARRVGR